jgi:L-seryl-tRNA(Ser) seleniumtransferase
VAGQSRFVDPMRRNPLYRALRVDKMTLAALDATLVEHQQGRAHERLPVLRMVAATRAQLAARAESFARAVAAAAPALAPALVEDESRVGGGAAPELGLASVTLALDPGPAGADALALALRRGSPPVVARVALGRVRIDLRTILPDEEDLLLEALVAAAR